MAKLDDKSSEVKTKKAKIVDAIVFTLLLLGAIAMVFPLIYMLLSSFMTKNQILSCLLYTSIPGRNPDTYDGKSWL